MGIRKYKPTSPGRRHGTVLDFGRDHQHDSREEPASAAQEDRRSQQPRTHHLPSPWWWTQAPLPPDRLQAQQGRHPRQGRDDRIRSGIALRELRCCTTSTAKSATSSALIGLEVGQMVASGSGAEPLPGNSMCLADIPVGLTIHNIELKSGRGGQICRSAGVSAQLQAREGNYAVVLLPSGGVAPHPCPSVGPRSVASATPITRT